MTGAFIFLDFETCSRYDLKTRGLDNYARDPSTRALMLAWAINDQPPQLWLPPEPMPEQLEMMLPRKEFLKIAWEAEFERTIFKHVLGIDISIDQWLDPKVLARYASMSGGLEAVGKILNLDEDKAKLAVGKKLIKLFSMPNKAGEFFTKDTHPEEWEMFCDYCRRDVLAEKEIFHKLKKTFALPRTELAGWRLDQKINDRGIPVDMKFVEGATKIVKEEKALLIAEMRELTSCENPNSTKQILEWLKTEAYPFGSLGAKWVTQALLPGSGVSQKASRVLELRQMLSKSSTAKLDAIANFVSADGRLRRQYVFYGAARTGRWSGRSVQLQNLPRGNPEILKRFDEAVEAIRTGELQKVREFGSPLDVVSSCLRGAFRA